MLTPTPSIDVDGNGTYDPLIDGLLLIRYLSGPRGNALVAGTLGATGATRTNAMDIELYLKSLTP